jgi:ArsR family transcriptional regulator
MMTPRKPDFTDLPPSLRALADPTRLKIMLMLEGRRRTVGEIVEFFQLAQPTISRHLQTLSHAGLVRRTKEGQFVYYETDAPRVREVCVTLVASFPCCCVAVESPAIRGEGSPGAETGVPHRKRRKGGSS